MLAWSARIESVKRVEGVDLGERGMKEVVVGEGEDGFERWCLGIGKERKRYKYRRAFVLCCAGREHGGAALCQ